MGDHPEEKENGGLTDAARAEIKAAIDILRSDGLHIHKTYASFLKSQEEGKKEEESPKEGEPPPKKEDENPPAKKKGLWWGETEEE